MLMRLQGREHEVATGIAVCVQGTLRSAVERVRVRFRPFNVALAGAYASWKQASAESNIDAPLARRCPSGSAP
mgnify:CR=1 FL=1